MKRDHGYTLRVLHAVRDFLTRTPVTVAVGDIEVHRKQLDAHIARLTQVTEERAARGRAAAAGTTTLRRLARRLRYAYIRPVIRAGQTLDGVDQSALRALTMPKYVTFEQLITVANEISALVERHQVAFSTAGFPAETTARMREAAGKLQEEVNARSMEVARRSATVSGAVESALAARRFLRMLDATLDQALEDDIVRWSEWKQVVKRFGNRARTEQDVDAGPAAPSVPVGEEVKAA
jgi:hypothetical protein